MSEHPLPKSIGELLVGAFEETGVGQTLVEGVVGVYEDAMSKRYPEKIEFVAQASSHLLLLLNLDVAFGSLRRCLHQPQVKETHEKIRFAFEPGGIYTCHRPAAWRMKKSPTESIYFCDICFGLFPEVSEADREQWFEVPYVDALRRFMRLLWEHDGKSDVPDAMERSVKIAEDLLAALPRCPNPFGHQGICPRHDYALSEIPLLELEQTLYKFYVRQDAS
jgi:hypothetical protein